MDRISPFFHATPWFLPGVVLASVLAAGVVWALRPRLAPAPLSWAFLTTVGSYVALVDSPTRIALDGYPGGTTSISMGIVLPPVSEMTGVTDVTLNVAAGFALGLLGTWLTRSLHAAWPVLVAAGLPMLAELGQWAVPELGRSGFLVTDVLVAYVGVGLGAAVAAIVPVHRTHDKRLAHPSHPSA